MATKQYDMTALINKLDPDRNGPRVEYRFGGGKIQKKQRQTQPGKTYRWR